MLKTKVIKSLLGAAIVAASAAPFVAYAQAPTTGTAATAPAAAKLSKADRNIVIEMARGNIAEIETGKIAVNKSQNADVKAFAQRMIDDHTTALNDIKSLAQAKGITLPDEPDAKHKAMAKKLEKMEGDAFDRAYMKQAGVSDHTQMHVKLRKDADRAKDADVKALASKLMPTVEQHLSSAKAMPMTNGSGKEKKPGY